MSKPTPPTFLMGLTAALALTWAAFEWTSFEWSTARAAAFASLPTELLEVEVVPASVPVKPPPPPAPMTASIMHPEPRPEPVGRGPVAPEPDPGFFTGWDDLLGPEPDPTFSTEPLTLLVADHMPAFADCADVLDPDAERQCTEQRIIEYMQECVKFPRHMRDAGIDGVVYLEYLIDENGRVRTPRILKSPHSAFEATTLECIEGLPVLNPGRQQGRPVRVQYTLPVRFSLH